MRRAQGGTSSPIFLVSWWLKTLCVLVVEIEAGNGQVWYLDLRSC